MISWLKAKPSASHFDQAVRAYSGQLYQYAFWLCRDRHRAEDILQEAFVRAWKYWDQVDTESARRSWLYTIVRNEFLRAVNRDSDAPAQLDDDSDIALDQVDERDFTRALEVRELLERLPEVHLEPLLLQSLVGMTCEEIAVVLGISTAAAMTRMTRARIALRALLAEPGDAMATPSKSPKLRVVRSGEST